MSEEGAALSTPEVPACRHDEYLTDLLNENTFVVLVFYRGKWCPFCRSYLTLFNRMYRRIKADGGEVVGICAEVPEEVDETKISWGIRFPMLSDEDTSLSKRYNLAISAPTQRYRYGMSNSGLLVLANTTGSPIRAPDADMIMRWSSFPSEQNHYGAMKRPHPEDVLTIAKMELRENKGAEEAKRPEIRTVSSFHFGTLCSLMCCCGGKGVPKGNVDTLTANGKPADGEVKVGTA